MPATLWPPSDIELGRVEGENGGWSVSSTITDSTPNRGLTWILYHTLNHARMASTSFQLFRTTGVAGSRFGATN